MKSYKKLKHHSHIKILDKTVVAKSTQFQRMPPPIQVSHKNVNPSHSVELQRPVTTHASKKNTNRGKFFKELIHLRNLSTSRSQFDDETVIHDEPKSTKISVIKGPYDSFTMNKPMKIEEGLAANTIR